MFETRPHERVLLRFIARAFTSGLRCLDRVVDIRRDIAGDGHARVGRTDRHDDRIGVLVDELPGETTRTSSRPLLGPQRHELDRVSGRSHSQGPSQLEPQAQCPGIGRCIVGNRHDEFGVGAARGPGHDVSRSHEIAHGNSVEEHDVPRLLEMSEDVSRRRKLALRTRDAVAQIGCELTGVSTHDVGPDNGRPGWCRKRARVASRRARRTRNGKKSRGHEPRHRLSIGPVTEPETPIAWSALARGTPVYSSDGREIGKVAEVIADEQKDIFSGISVDPGWFKDERFVPADLIASLSAAAVRLRITAGAAEARLEPNTR
jgi:hypothetical protein